MPNSQTTSHWDERLSQLIDVRHVTGCEFKSLSEVCLNIHIPDTLDTSLWTFRIWRHFDCAEHGSRV